MALTGTPATPHTLRMPAPGPAFTAADAEATTYDVTAISHGSVHVSLIHGTVIWVACDIAKDRSRDAMWSAVQIRESGTGQIVDTYADGEREGK